MTQGTTFEDDLLIALRALSNERRLAILDWLKSPRSHFREQVDGDLARDGVCGASIAEKLGVSQPTASEHMRVLVGARLVETKRTKRWTFYSRNEQRICELKRLFSKEV